MNDITAIVARQRAFFETGKTLPVTGRKEALARLRREILADRLFELPSEAALCAGICAAAKAAANPPSGR